LGLLRARFVAIVGRRVPPDAVEDIVQDALRVVCEKADGLDPALLDDGWPRASWSFQVLRNTVGNHYSRMARRSDHRTLDLRDAGPAPGPTPMEARDVKELRRILHGVLHVLGESHPDCGRYLQRLVDGLSPAAVASEEGLAPGALHRRLYRCRMVLRSLLAEQGVLA
jgi:DNA-directed RNA polymerase specialized sigma24 family protein